jgi:hypothetical protein
MRDGSTKGKAVEVGGQALGLNLGDSARQIGLAQGRAAERQAGHLLGEKACHQVGGLLLGRWNLTCGVGQIAGVHQKDGASTVRSCAPSAVTRAMSPRGSLVQPQGSSVPWVCAV